MNGSQETLYGVAIVADGDVDRGKEIAEALAGCGLSTRFAAHGAEALEAALAEPPDVVVASLGLPLIDAPQLASILRANPRTQGARILVVGGGRDEASDHAAIDARLPGPASPEEVVRHVATLMGSSQTSQDGDLHAAGESELEGKLTQLALADLLQLFHMNRKTGTVELTRRGREGSEERGSILVTDGNVVDARCGVVEGEKALYRLLAWGSGSFRYVRTRPRGAARIRTPTRTLLLEGVRQLDELARVRSELPPPDAELRLKVSRADLPAVVQPLTREVLELIGTFPAVGDVLDHSRHPDYQVLRTIQMLSDRGIVEILRRRGERRVCESEALFSEDQLGRLRAWAARCGGPGSPLRDVRLLVAGSDPGATKAFLSQLDGLPGVCLDRNFRDGRFSRSTLRRMGRLGPEDDVGIELFHLPTHPTCEPFWPLAVASAQVVLLVLGTPARDDVRALRDLRRILEDDGRLRCLSVVMEDAARRTPPPETDSGAGGQIFHLAADGSSHARAALARLLASLVP